MPTEASKPVVLVTGGAGLIGRRVCRHLADRYTVIALDIKELKDASGVRWIECDFTNGASVAAALEMVRGQYGSEIASVVHLAAYYDFSGEPSPLYQELTVEGTRRLLNSLKDFQRVEQFIFSSSLLVMQPCEPGEYLSEYSPTEAEWEYPQSKLDAEEAIRDEHGTIPTVILRVAGVYDEDGHSLPITQNIRRIAEKEFESYFFPGDSKRGQAFVHLDDLVNCIDLAVQKRNQLSDFETFLIAEDECLSYERLQDQIGELIHGVDDWPTVRIPKFVAKAGAWVKQQVADEEDQPFIKPWMVDLADAHYAVNNQRAQSKLGWQPQHRLSATLPEMIRRLKQNPRKWYETNGLPLADNSQALKELAASAFK